LRKKDRGFRLEVRNSILDKIELIRWCAYLMMNLVILLSILIVLPGLASSAERSGEAVLDYTLEVAFDVPASAINGLARIPVAQGQGLKLDIGSLKLIRVTIDDQEIKVAVEGSIARIDPPRTGLLAIMYEGVFKDTPDRQQLLDVISDKGISLTGTWYPRPDRLCRYHLTAVAPQGYEAISEAETIEKSSANGRTVFTFNFPHPLEGINLIASHRYRVVKDSFEGIEILAYFFPEDADLSKTYIDRTKGYLKLYEGLIGKYPYKRFSIVENFLPTGYSMPTYTLLGQGVLRLPFIPETSLGHEILHQWFGNSVYIDFQKGNWAEGLTTFLADLFYQEEKGRGPEYRKGTLIDYQSYINEGNEFPLRDFTEKTGPASEAIGYGKTAMVFQMLKDMLGPERFYQSIKDFSRDMRFRKASWEDLRKAFEKHHQGELTWFFNQWIDGKGLPDLHLEETQVKPSGSGFEVAFKIVQKGKAYTLDLPVTIYAGAGSTKRNVHLSKEQEKLEIAVKEFPGRIALDEDYQVARRLSITEFPPVIARLLGDEKRIIVPSPSKPEIYERALNALKTKSDKIRQAKGVSFEDLKTHSFIIFGADNPLLEKLYGAFTGKGGFNVAIKENPWNRSKVVGIVQGLSKDEVDAASQKIVHYGKYSALSFDQGRNTAKIVTESERGIGKELNKKAVVVDLSTLKTFRAMTERTANKKIIYVGENHDRYSNHLMELEIVMDLHRRGKKVAIGMEMFQRPFQNVVDAYIEGRIDEAAFLKGTEYFKRWKFDYNLYRPILLFARSEKIPVVALNQKQEIVDKVFRKGVDSLSIEEKESLPKGMDFSDEAYRKRLKTVFLEHAGFHKGVSEDSFDFFFQAQIVWDETMSESIDQFLKAHSDHQMVVLAGNGHLAHASGIPKRTARRNGHDYAVVLNDADVDKGIADFVLFPEAISGPASPKLMAILEEEGGRVRIAGFPENSFSQQAGMKTGDIILSVDRKPVHTVDDVRIDLLSRNKGDKLGVRVRRQGVFGFTREIDFELVLR
jgi:aminopeptidase N